MEASLFGNGGATWTRRVPWAMRAAGVAWGWSSLIALGVTAVVWQWGPTPHLLPYAYWQGWDARWYQFIATQGYARPIYAAFFPLYPAILAGSHAVAPGAPLPLLAVLLSSLALYGALIPLCDLAQRYAVPAAVSLWLALPTAFFCRMAYSDSLEVALVAGALAAAERRWWGVVALCGVAAGLTRPTGVCLVPPLLLLWGARQGWRRQTLVGVAVSVTPLVGLALVGGIDAVAYHDPLAFLHAQHWFGRSGFAGLDGFRLLLTQLTSAPSSAQALRLLLDDAPLLAAVGALPFAWRRLPPAYAALVTAVVAQIALTPIQHALTPHAYPSAARYLLLAFPLLWLPAAWVAQRPHWLVGVCGVGVAVQAALLWALAGSYWFP